MKILSPVVVLECPRCGMILPLDIHPRDFKGKDNMGCLKCKVWMKPLQAMREAHLPEDPKITKEKLRVATKLKSLFTMYVCLDYYGEE